MLDDAAEDGIDLKVVSAYRSFDEQDDLKGQYTQLYGSGANTFSADQGYSEHQLGTTLDLTTPTIGGAYTSFATTEAFAWLRANAYKYGFILSYPENNTFYVYEPWHWRFVGEDLARDLHRADAHFYDWDQRKIDEYLISIFD
jgi:zinc D-Ala-D-Ala carboxypeptidase